jgi:phospholipid transport system substrate-binding protein
MTMLGRLIVGIAVSSLLAGTAGAGEPLEKIRETVEAVLAIISDDSLQSPERRVLRRERLRQTVYQRFGFEEMARRALGRHWRNLDAAQRQEFVGLFSDLLERSYVDKIESTGAGSEVDYTRETIDAEGFASVMTVITNRLDSQIEVEYRLLQRDGNTPWEVYDIVIEGVSLINNYRTQFNNIIHRTSYDGLVKQLRLKQEQEEAAE